VDLTSRQLRTGIRSPDVLVREIHRQARGPAEPNTPHSPQRPGIEAALRRYFDGGRVPDTLRSDFESRVARWKRRDSAASEINNARQMLERFLRLDRAENDPLRVFMVPERCDVLGVGVALGYDLVYEVEHGILIRQLLTDSEIRRTEHLRLYAAAIAIHYTSRNLPSPLTRVQIWYLRYEHRIAGWPAALLLGRPARDLSKRLGAISRGLSGWAA
jgi:hypothetical protein